MKMFVYFVEGKVWEDFEAWGKAWKAAKDYAIQQHGVIFRDVVRADKVKHEVYYKAGIFNSIEFMREDNVKVW